MNNINSVSAAPQNGANNIINKNVLAWQEARRENARHQRVASEARQFRANFGKVGLAFPKGFALA